MASPWILDRGRAMATTHGRLVLALALAAVSPCAPHALASPHRWSSSPRGAVGAAATPHERQSPSVKPASETTGTEAAARWFRKLDVDGDGTISVAEFIRGYEQLEEELSPPVRDSIGLAAERMVANFAQSLVSNTDSDQRTVRLSLSRLKGDLEELDYRAGERVKLTEPEIILLTMLTAVSFSSPAFFSTKVVEVLIPSMAGLSAALGLTFEYVGKVAVSAGKEVAANSLQAASEAEAQLAAAERAKAVLPLCAGVSASASAFALLAPALLEHLMPNAAVLVSAEYFLLCPCVSILAAAIAALSAEDTALLCDKAKSIGERRFASRTDVQQTWMSVSERVAKEGEYDQRRWLSFALSVLPAPVLATIMPGALGEKCVLAAATAAAQAAYHLAKAVRLRAWASAFPFPRPPPASPRAPSPPSPPRWTPRRSTPLPSPRTPSPSRRASPP